MRIGIGYDIHRLVEGRRLLLAGVEFPGPVGLEGHSDADAVMHAVADAILGAAALGDLGEFFPDTDEQWRDVPSAQIMGEVMKMAARRKLEVYNVDINVIAQSPRLGEAKKQMRHNIAALVGVPVGRVSVKARTAEGLGPVGTGQAIEVQAVVLLQETAARRATE